jgi:hypothetical protein
MEGFEDSTNIVIGESSDGRHLVVSLTNWEAILGSMSSIYGSLVEASLGFMNEMGLLPCCGLSFAIFNNQM